METKKCPICHTFYEVHLPACPHCKESNMGGVKMDKQTNEGNYDIGSYEDEVALYRKQKKIIQYIATIALCLSIALVVWCLIITE